MRWGREGGGTSEAGVGGLTWDAVAMGEGEWVWRGKKMVLENGVEESAMGAAVDAKVYHKLVVG